MLPLGIEFLSNNFILTGKSATISASMYAISIGASTRFHILFSICVLISIAEAIMYGFVLHVENHAIMNVSMISLIVLTITLLAERYYRHITQKEPFFAFKVNNK